MEDLRTHRQAMVVPSEEASQRLDRFLAARWPEKMSRSSWQRSITMGLVEVNGKLGRAKDTVHAGDRVEVLPLPTTPTTLLTVTDEAFDPVRILYHDGALLVVDKPAGIVVHPSRGHAEDTLVNYLLPWLTVPDADGEFRPGIVHRLDKDTTGCLLVARTPSVKEALTRAIGERLIERYYLAVIEGTIVARRGTIEAPVGRDPKNRLRMAVVRSGREARTHFVTIARWPRHSLLLLKLDTGRTHQIRVHLRSLGHPLVGDSLYGGQAYGTVQTQALHAWRIRFHHPVNGNELTFNAPLPLTFSELWGHLAEPSEVTWPDDGTGPWSSDIPGALLSALTDSGFRWPDASQSSH